VADRPATSAAIRERNLHVVLDALRAAGPASRSDIAARTGLSKPTVGAALRSFEGAGIVRQFGRTTGHRGPSASLYDLDAGAALVLGVDVGAHYARAQLADLDGAVVDELTIRVQRPTAEAVVAALREVAARIADHAEQVELAVVGWPGIVDPVTGRISAAPNIAGWDGLVAEAVAGAALGLPVVVDNDVNLAALGERRAGAGKDVDSFAYLSIGSGLGAGIVLHGRLHRGARGAAGEVGFLPVGEDPFAESEAGGRGAMEARLSAGGLLAVAERLAATTPSELAAPFEVADLFAAARAGDALGRAVVAHAARETAVCVAGLTSVVDLELVLLGGGIGTNAEFLLPDVRAATAALVPAPPHIECAALDDRAVTVGAVAVGLERARSVVVRRLVDGGVERVPR
jgi:predicted NBD/HSP70 family sugar kinase